MKSAYYHFHFHNGQIAILKYAREMNAVSWWHGLDITMEFRNDAICSRHNGARRRQFAARGRQRGAAHRDQRTNRADHCGTKALERTSAIRSVSGESRSTDWLDRLNELAMDTHTHTHTHTHSLSLSLSLSLSRLDLYTRQYEWAQFNFHGLQNERY